LGASPLGEGLVKTAPSKEASPSLKPGKEGKGVPDSAMEMALKIKDPAIQAQVTRTLKIARGVIAGSKDSGSTTEDEEEEWVSAKEERARKKEKLGEEERVSAREERAGKKEDSGEEERMSANEERARKEQERGKQKSKKEKGVKRAESQTSGKSSKKKIKRSKPAEEVKEKRIEEVGEPAPDLEMMDALDPLEGQQEGEREQLRGEQEEGLKQQCTGTEPLKEESEEDRLKRQRTKPEGRKLMQESIVKVLKGAVPERTDEEMLNVQEGQ
jgi:hypothetical protein